MSPGIPAICSSIKDELLTKKFKFLGDSICSNSIPYTLEASVFFT